MNVFVTGTDTGVGKTIASAVLLDYLKDYNPFYFKPIQTGAIEDKSGLLSEDIETINQFNCSFFSIEQSVAYLLKAPMSAYQAACKENVIISLAKIVAQHKALLAKHQNVISEGAGGVLVPVTSNKTMLDLIKAMNSRVVVIVRPGLGTINHSLLTIKALKDKKVKIAGFIVNNYPQNEDEITKENPIMIEKYSGVECLGRIMQSANNTLPVFMSKYDKVDLYQKLSK